MRHAVFQYNERYPLIIKECGPLMALMIYGQMGIASTRTTNYSTARSLIFIRQINSYFRFILIIRTCYFCPIRPQFHRSTILAISHTRNHQQQHGEYSIQTFHSHFD